jgi:archaellum biogenesis protein FlaJ (TadC family)
MLDVQWIFVAANVLLSFAATDGIKSMVLFRSVAIWVLHLISTMVVFSTSKKEEKWHRLHPPINNTPLLHLLWGIQVYLNPGLWVWIEKLVKTNVSCVYLLWYATLAWVLGGFLLAAKGIKVEGDKERKEGQAAVKLDSRSRYFSRSRYVKQIRE